MITLRLDKNGGINKGDIKAFEHDNKSEVYIIQLYKNGAIYDLTNKTVELTMVERKRKIGDMVSLPVYEATEGKVKLEVTSDITKQDGIYDFKLTVKDTTGLIETFPNFQVKIENDITDSITGEIIQDPNFTILTDGLKALADYNIYKTNALKVPEIEQDIVEINEQLEQNTKEINNYTTNYLSLHRLGRKLIQEKSGNHNNCQSMVWLDGDIIVQSFQLFQGNTVNLVKMNIKTGEELASNIINGFHANGMCYNTVDNFIYLTPAHNDEQTEFFKNILKIDINTLSIVESIDLTSKTNLEYLASIGFDELNNQYIVNYRNSFEVYSLDWIKIKSFTINYQYEEDRFQTITVFNGKLYQVTSAPETIWVYDLSEDKITSVLNVDKWQDKIYNLGEIEGLSFNKDNGDLYITSQSRYTETFGGSLTQFWITNLKTNYVDSSKLIRFQQAQEETTVFANNTIESYNPSGRYDKPFTTLSEAMTALSSPYVGSKILQLESAFDENLVISNGCSDLVVNGAEKGIKSLIMLYATNVYIPTLKITGSSSFKNSAIYMYMSELMTTAIEYTPISGLDNYAIIERSKITVPTNFLNATDITVLLKNSKCYVNQQATNRLRYSALLKENENNHFEGIKWSNGSLSSSVTRPADWKSYRKARVIYRFNGLSELTKEVNFDSDGYTIRIDGVYQNDSNEIRVFSGYLKPQSVGSNTYIKGTASGYSYINGVMSLINNSDITITFDIAFYD